MNSSCCRGVFAAVLGALTAPAFALSVGMVDALQGGSTDGWITGGPSPNPPSNVNSGGPAGVGDKYLLLTSTGSGGPGGKLVVFNGTQWAGNYLSAGVTNIRMDVNNLGATDLHLRLAFSVFPFVDGNSVFSKDALVAPAGSGWTQFSFPVDPSALLGPDATAALSNVGYLRLYHNPNAALVGSDVAAQLGVDNVTAVPEPGAWLILAAGLAAVVASKNLRRRRSR